MKNDFGAAQWRVSREGRLVAAVWDASGTKAGGDMPSCGETAETALRTKVRAATPARLWSWLNDLPWPLRFPHYPGHSGGFELLGGYACDLHSGDAFFRWSLLGDGPSKPECQRAARALPNVVFEARLPYAALPARIHRADILLGVFGATQKAGRVIPNKVFQALASGRPVVTRVSEAYPAAARESEAVAWVPAGDPRALADAVAAWASDPARFAARNQAARSLYEACFAAPVIRAQLAAALDGLG